MALVPHLLEECRGRKLAHRLQRLAHCRQAGHMEAGGQDVVEADHRDICGNAQATVVKCADAADSRDVVEADERR